MNRDIRRIAEKFKSILIYLFGSQADKGYKYIKGDQIIVEAFSDLDIAVLFKDPPDKSVEIYANMFKDFSKLFEPFRIDLVFMHEVSTLFQYEIIKGIRIFEKEDQLIDEFEESIMSKAEDLLFKKRIFDKEVMEAIEDGYIEIEYSPNP